MSDQTLSTRTSLRRRFARLGAAAVLTAALCVGTAVAPASAWLPSSSGAVAATWMDPYYVSTAGIYNPTLRTIAGPVLTTGRTYAASNGLPQRVTVNFELMRWNGAVWSTVWNKSFDRYINYNQTSSQFVADSFGAWPRGYYYTFRTTVRWYNNSGQVTGVLLVRQNSASEGRCIGIANCTPTATATLVG